MLKTSLSVSQRVASFFTRISNALQSAKDKLCPRWAKTTVHTIPQPGDGSKTVYLNALESAKGQLCPRWVKMTVHTRPQPGDRSKTVYLNAFAFMQKMQESCNNLSDKSKDEGQLLIDLIGKFRTLCKKGESPEEIEEIVGSMVIESNRLDQWVIDEQNALAELAAERARNEQVFEYSTTSAEANLGILDRALSQPAYIPFLPLTSKKPVQKYDAPPVPARGFWAGFTTNVFSQY